MFTNKKGYTILEVSLAISLFSILFLGILTLEVSKIKLKAINKKKEMYILSFQALKTSMINDLTYDELKSLYEGGKKYINFSEEDVVKFDQINIREVLVSEIRNKGSYIDISLMGEKPVKVIMKWNVSNSLMNEVFLCEFYKGNYY